MKKLLLLFVAVAFLSGLALAHAQYQGDPNQDEKGPVNIASWYFTQYMAFDNMNGGGVNNNPPVATTFTLAVNSLITMIQTYHWNSGMGANFGTIKLIDAGGVVYGPWTAVGAAGCGKTFWVVTPNKVLPDGIYTIVDSDKATWSYNAQSSNKGFAKVIAKKR